MRQGLIFRCVAPLWMHREQLPPWSLHVATSVSEAEFWLEIWIHSVWKGTNLH